MNLKFVFIIFSIIYSSFIFGDSLFLVNDKNTKTDRIPFFLYLREGQINISGRLELSALGLSLSGEIKTFILKNSFLETLAKTNGFFSIPEENKALYSKIPEFPVEVSSTVHNLDQLNTIVKSSVNMFTNEEVDTYRLFKTPLEIDFLDHGEVQSDRKTYNEVTLEKQQLASSVFQILTDFGMSSLGTTSSTHGTGFFISNNGHALTNLHVVKENPGCLREKVCHLNISFKGHETTAVNNVKTDVLTCSVENDFCLIRLNISNEKMINHLEMQFNHIPKKLFTLGFPGDMEIETEHGIEVPLSYSFGSPIGLSGKAISSTVFIAGGASGSPFIDKSNNKVVGIVSNAAETFAAKYDGAPGIFRPLYIIEKDFSLTNYLNGNKEKIVSKIINNIENTNNEKMAKNYIHKYISEKTYIGFSRIVELAYGHQNREVRRQLVNLLLSGYDLNW